MPGRLSPSRRPRLPRRPPARPALTGLPLSHRSEEMCIHSASHSPQSPGKRSESVLQPTEKWTIYSITLVHVKAPCGGVQARALAAAAVSSGAAAALSAADASAVASAVAVARYPDAAETTGLYRSRGLHVSSAA